MLGEKIRKLRKDNKISQEALAEKLGVSRQSISLWENDQTMPSMENIVAISNVFGVSTDALLNNNEQKENEEIAPEENVENTSKPKRKLNKKFLIILSIILAIAIVATSVFVLVDKFSNKKLTAEDVFELIAPSTVEINAEGDTFTSTGTGCFIDNDGTIVTNYHVIESCHTISIKTQDGSTCKVVCVLGFDKDRDLAIIKADCQNESFVTLKTDEVKTGEKVYTLGSSLGLTGTFSEGIISSAAREIEGFDFIQITAPISSGNSGGPLVDEYGKVIGITTGAFTEGQNLNLAIPASAINDISRKKEYSVNDFFQISEGKIVESNDKKSKEEVKEKIQNWLTENGEVSYEGVFLVEKVKYTTPINEDCSLEITNSVNEGISCTLFMNSSKQYKIHFYKLFESTDSLYCEITDQAGTGNICLFDKENFTKNSPIEIGESLGDQVNGIAVINPKIEDGKLKVYYFSATEGEKSQEITVEHKKTIAAIEKEFSSLSQYAICSILDYIDDNLCEVWNVSLKDLGYNSFE